MLKACSDNIVEERWLSVCEYEGIYSVSSLGRLRRENTMTNTFKRKIIMPFKSKGYSYVTLCKHNTRRTVSVASIVLRAFRGSRPEGLVINHIDFNRANNIPNNLEYVTQKQNLLHSRLNGRMNHHNARKGVSHQSAKLSDWQVLAIRKLYKTSLYSHRWLSKRFGVSHRAIGYIINRKTWKHI